MTPTGLPIQHGDIDTPAVDHPADESPPVDLEGHDHRRTAADWHGGQRSPLGAYASTGTVARGLDGEITDCLALIDRGAIGPDTDPEVERERLLALLYHVELDVAVVEAGEIGRQHGASAAEWWHQDALGGRATGDRTALARQVQLGIYDGDPAVLDMLPVPDSGYGQAELEDDCDWEEPLDGDPVAHNRWDAGRDRLSEAYTSSFDDTMVRAVAGYCRAAVVDAHLERIAVRSTHPGLTPVSASDRGVGL